MNVNSLSNVRHEFSWTSRKNKRECLQSRKNELETKILETCIEAYINIRWATNLSLAW